MKYKVGDKVRVRSWESMEKEFRLTVNGNIEAGAATFLHKMAGFCGKIVTIKEISIDLYRIEEDNGEWNWTDEMFEPVAFDWDAFKNPKNKIAVHCKTEEEAKDFCKKMHEHGLRWGSGKSYLDHTKWGNYGTIVYYSDGDYSNLIYAEGHRYTILEWSDYMKKEFTKSDLKYGYMVKFRNGEKALYMPSGMGDSFDWCNNVECLSADNYDEELKYKEARSKKYDIVEVRGFSSTRYQTTILEESERPLIWEREEKPVLKMTVEEMKQKLSEIMNAEIVEQQ